MFGVARSLAASQRTAFVSLRTCKLTHPYRAMSTLIHGFERVEARTVPEYEAKATLFRHARTGAQLLSVEKDDDNKVFGITFRTPVANSKGIPHILEHCVLCGSRQYPTKEPFVELLKGSLQTFLNAFTYPDRTCYPVASQNLKDFHNLVNVYMDAVFHPLAVEHPKAMQQEGWHYEVDESGSLVYKGVVYNEMKGVYSSPDSLLHRAVQHLLFPNVPSYSEDSGGNPAVIPRLTFEEFREFHRLYYHPSNARLYFYGNDNVESRLELADRYLGGFNALPSAPLQSEVPWQPLLNHQPTKVVEYPAQNHHAKWHTQVAWLLNDQALGLKDQLGLAILDHLLLGSPSSVLYKALTDSALGESVSGGYEDELKQAVFGVGMKGVDGEEQCNKVHALIEATLRDVVANSFASEAVAASMNSVEFSLREFNVGGFPKGLALMLGIMKHWVHDQDGIAAIRFEHALADLKADIANGQRVFESLVERFLLSNPHRVVVHLKPNQHLERLQKEEEESRLAEVQRGLTAEQLQEIVDNERALKAAQQAQDSPEARATIPRLSLGDVERAASHIAFDSRSVGAVRVYQHSLPTAGVVYADLELSLEGLTTRQLLLVPLLARMMSECGTSRLDATAFDRDVNTHTGGVSVSTSLLQPLKGNVVADPESVLPFLSIKGKALPDKVTDLFRIMHDMLLDANLNQQQRVLAMLREAKAGKESSIVGSGHSYASSRIASRHSLIGYLQDCSGGVPSYFATKALLKQVETQAGWEELLKELEGIRAVLLSQSRASMLINLTCPKETMGRIAPTVDAFVSSLPNSPTSPPSKVHEWVAEWRRYCDAPPLREGLVVPTQVNYVSKGVRVYEPGEHVCGATSVVHAHLRTGYLWEKVRVVGGAYGAMGSFSPSLGTVVCTSYRDPNLAATLRVYDNLGKSLVQTSQEVEQEELELAVIGTIGDMDSPMSENQKGATSMRRILSGVTHEARQQWRDEVLATNRTHFEAHGQRVAHHMQTDAAHVVVIGSAQAFANAKAEGVELELRNVFDEEGEGGEEGLGGHED